jgi:hypothetical protein
MMDRTVNKITGENKRPDMKTLTFADDVLLRGKDEKKSEEKLNH